MSDDATEILMPVGGEITIDANRIGVIILDDCHTSEARAAKAANRIVEYLIEAFNDARMRAQQ